MVTSSLPPLLPRVDAVLILDGDGNRLAGKYYGDFLTSTASATNSSTSADGPNTSNLTVEDLRTSFERQLQTKIQGIAARPDAAEVITVMNKTAVFCGGTAHGATPTAGSGDVRLVHIGPSTESELLLAHLCEGMFDALNHLMGGQIDRNMVLDNLELVFLLIDEHCDGGIILEVDGSKLASSVLLREDDEEGQPGGADGSAATGMNGVPANGMGMNGAADLTLAQAFRQARMQFMGGMGGDM